MDGEHIEEGIPIPLTVVRAVVVAVCLAEGTVELIRLVQTAPLAVHNAAVTLVVRGVMRPVVAVVVKPAARAGLRALAVAVLRATDREDEEEARRAEQAVAWEGISVDEPLPAMPVTAEPVELVH